MANGNRHEMYIVKETAYGITPGTPAFKYFRHNTTTLAQAKNTLQSEEIRPNRQLMDFRMGTGQTGGDIVSELAYTSFDDALSGLMFNPWASNKLSIGVLRQSFTIVRLFADLEGTAPNDKKYQTYVGMEFNTLALQVNTEAITQATFGMVGKAMTLSSTGPVGATYGLPDVTSAMDSFTGTITEDGVQIGVITEIQLSIENGIEPRFVVGSKQSIRPSSGRCNVTGQITAYFEDSYLLEKFINEQTSNIEFTLTDGEAGNSYKFVIPRIKYTGGQTDVSGPGAVSIPMPFQATYDATSDTTLSIERIPAPVGP